MKKTLLLIGLSFILFGCNNCDPEMINAALTNGKTIVAIYDSTYQRNEYTIESGENILFEYNHSGRQCDKVYDDEWGEILTFEIDKNTTEFEFVDSNIITSKCFYQEYGAWVKHNSYQVKDGFIKGKKISIDQWEITVSVNTTPLFSDETPKAIEFQRTFSK